MSNSITATHNEQKTTTKKASTHASALHTMVTIATVVNVLAVAIAVIAGFAMAVQTKTVDDGYDTTHPYGWLGLGIIAGALVSGLFTQLFVAACEAVADIRTRVSKKN